MIKTDEGVKNVLDKNWCLWYNIKQQGQKALLFV
ncbi:hypothetical protein AJ81_06520 [Pseudothermotoga hypogea DSM 11164 = NBRC 106472]|uniref:Uncharacterized protein n=1 Tax=Pseudothermotoga hypogea DSM 11164 = NBRC 106472 TaxID=1123384 RepID=A0A0X1KUC4_9THEM|nr:hypothetical protein AJ81_06520 [Pseudothermotoga hypogea DSM 11164 = NBRC 106472]